MDPVVTEGDSVEAAVATALAQLGLARDAVAVEVLEEPTRGFLGIGAKPARVRVRPTSPQAPQETHAPQDPQAPQETHAPHAPTDLAEHARGQLGEILERMGVAATVTAACRDERIELDIQSADGAEIGGWLIGRRGQTLDALEYLVARIVGRNRQQPVHLVIDAEGYRGRRAAALAEMARRMAAQAKQSGRPVPLAPMSPRERRIVHMVLQDDPGVRTHSTGEGPQRHLVIAPAGRR